MQRVGTRTCGEPSGRVGAALGLLLLTFRTIHFPKSVGGRQTDVDGPRPGFTALKAGAGFGVWG